MTLPLPPKVLITGARGPATLEIVRQYKNNGYIVYTTDSLHCPFVKVSNCIAKYFTIHPPAKDTNQFINDLIHIIDKYQIDLLIPAYEEVFFISKYKQNLEKYCDVYCDEFEKLHSFHNKYTFTQVAVDCSAYIPITNKLTSTNIKNSENYVFKPMYSRFGDRVLIQPDQNKLNSINIKTEDWIMQEFIDGVEHCSYSTASKGEVLSSIAYKPVYKVGKGSSMYFEPVNNAEIEEFIKQFVQKHNFTGQISFDFIIDKENKLYVLECNPRASSGIHCLYNNEKQKPKMLWLAMIVFGGKYIFTNQGFRFIRDFIKAQDTVFDIKDIKPFFYQFISLGEVVWHSLIKRIPFKDAATADIEWNGEDI